MRINSLVAGMFVATCLSLPSPLFGQNLELGVWAGRTSSTQMTSGVQYCSMLGCVEGFSRPGHERTATAAGLHVRTELNDRIALSLGVAWVPKGYGPGPYPADRRVESRYLEVPLAVQARLVSWKSLHVWIQTGVAPAFLRSCETSGTLLQGFESNDCAVPSSTTGTRRGPNIDHDIGWLVGPLVQLDTGLGTLHFELTQTRGLIDVEPDDRGKTTNRLTTVGIGFSREIHVF